MTQHTTPHLAPHEALRAEIAAFCAERGMTKTAFGKDALGDPGFVSGLEDGREPRWSTVQKVRRWMAEEVAKAERGAA